MLAAEQGIYKQMTKLAWRNVLRNWRHSLATLLAIASGFLAISLFDGFVKELEYKNDDGHSHRGMLGDVIVQKQDADTKGAEDQWAYTMTRDEQQAVDDFIAQDRRVAQRVRFLAIQGMATSGERNAVFVGSGYDISEGGKTRGDRWFWNAMAGSPLDHAKEPSLMLGLGLGKLVGCVSNYTGPSFFQNDGSVKAEIRPFACKNGRVTLSVTTEAAQVNAIDLPVVGLYDAGFREADKRAVHMPLADAQRLMDTDKISYMTISLVDPKDTSDFIPKLQDYVSSKGLKLDIMPWEEHSIATYVRGGMQILSVFRGLFMVIVVIIGVMAVANTMMKSVTERIREIGTLRSFGFLRRHLAYMFAAEGFFLSIIACAGGLIGTIGVSLLIGALGIKYRAGVLSQPITLQVKMVPEAWLASAIILSLLATGTAWICARRATRMVVADAMRHV